MLAATMCVFGAWAGIATVCAVLLYMDWTSTKKELQAEKKRYAGTIIYPPGKLKGLEDRNADLVKQLESTKQEIQQLQAHVEQTGQLCREASRRHGEIERLTQGLEQAHAEAAAQRRDCDVLRNQATELRERLRESKDQHASDVSLVNQLTVERDRLERRMLNIQDMSRTGKGVEVVKEHT